MPFSNSSGELVWGAAVESSQIPISSDRDEVGRGLTNDSGGMKSIRSGLAGCSRHVTGSKGGLLAILGSGCGVDIWVQVHRTVTLYYGTRNCVHTDH